MDREDTPLFPIAALREALATTFVHRDCSIGGGSVGVALYDDRLEIISIGDLHFGLTPELLYRDHESKPWNPMIAETFYRRGIIETWGRGTLKIARLMREAGHEPPVVSVRKGAVVLTFAYAPDLAGKAPGNTPERGDREAPGKTPQETQGIRSAATCRPRHGRALEGGRVSVFAESVVEEAALAWLGALGYPVLHGPDIAMGEPGAERTDPHYRDVVGTARSPRLEPGSSTSTCREQRLARPADA